MCMPEETRASRKSSGAASFLPNLIDRMFSTVETFAERLMTIVSESADEVMGRAVQRLFGLLLVIVGIAFILSGIGEIVNQVLGTRGAGEVIVGVLLLSLTAAVFLFIRRK